MKKYFLLLLLFSTIQTIYSQKLIKVTEKDLSINLPDNLTVLDTLGIKAYNAEMDKGYVGISTITDIRGEIKQSELDDFYKKFQKGMLETGQGKLISSSYLDIDSVKMYSYVMHTDTPNLIKWHVYVVRLRSTTYSVTFVYPEKNTKTDMEQQILNSIKIQK